MALEPYLYSFYLGVAWQKFYYGKCVIAHDHEVKIHNNGLI